MQIKASGGIRDYAFAQKLINAGATRIGCSAGVAIIEQSLIDTVRTSGVFNQSGIVEGNIFPTEHNQILGVI